MHRISTTNTMENTYKELLERFAANVPELKWIDLEYGQLDNPEGNYTPDYPAAFVRFSMPGAQTIGENVQHMDAEVHLRVAFRTWGDMNNKTPETVRNNALTTLAILKKVHAALQGYIGDNFSAMDRISVEQEQRDDGVLVFEMTYGSMIIDNSALPVRVKHNDLTLDLVLTKAKG